MRPSRSVPTSACCSATSGPVVVNDFASGVPAGGETGGETDGVAAAALAGSAAAATAAGGELVSHPALNSTVAAASPIRQYLWRQEQRPIRSPSFSNSTACATATAPAGAAEHPRPDASR